MLTDWINEKIGDAATCPPPPSADDRLHPTFPLYPNDTNIRFSAKDSKVKLIKPKVTSVLK